MMRKTIKQTVFVVASLSMALATAAQEFDGSKPMMCAAMNVFECVDGEECMRVRAEDINAPEFVRLDLKKMQASIGRGKDRKDRQIRYSESIGGRLVLQGIGDENGVAWSLSIEKASGRMVVSAAGEQAGFVIFGACTLL